MKNLSQSLFSSRSLFQNSNQRINFNKIQPVRHCFINSASLCTQMVSNFSSNNKNDQYSAETMKNLQSKAQEFYQNQIIEMKSIQEWEPLILKSPVPIVLDCYADWCEPCKKLTPLLQSHARAAGGKWLLVKVNIDEISELATALQIKSVPTVFLISGGNAIDMFAGIPDEKRMKQFFDILETACGESNNDQVASIDGEIREALLQMSQSNDFTSIAHIETINGGLSNEKFLAKFPGQALILQSLLAALENQTAISKNFIAEAQLKHQQESQEELMLSVIKYVQSVNLEADSQSNENPELKQLIEKVKVDPKNLHLRYQLSEVQLKFELYQDAIQNCLEIIQQNKNWEDKKANKLLVQVFEKLGNSNPLVIQARKQIQVYMN